jgi:hypothetical protein
MSIQYDSALQVDEQNASYSHQALYHFKIFMNQVVKDASEKGRLSDSSIIQLEKVKSQLTEVNSQEQSVEITTALAGIDNILIKTSLDPSFDVLVAQITLAHTINDSLTKLAIQFDERARKNNQKYADIEKYQFMLILIILILTLVVAVLFFYNHRRSKNSE